MGSSPGRAQVSAASRRAPDGAQRSRPGPPLLSRPPRPPERPPPSPADPRRSRPPRAHHHGAPARLLAAAAGRRPPAPRGAQPGRCEGESPAGSAPPASRPAPRAPRAAPLSPDPAARPPLGGRAWHGQVPSPRGPPPGTPVGCLRASIREPPLLWAGWGRGRGPLRALGKRSRARGAPRRAMVPGSLRDLNSRRGGLSGPAPSPALGALVGRGQAGWARAPHAAQSPTLVPGSRFGRVSPVLGRLCWLMLSSCGPFAWKQLSLLLSHDFSLQLKPAGGQKWGVCERSFKKLPNPTRCLLLKKAITTS